ncbi:MAG: hypothetical protein ACTHLW_04230 [Verrucomicrobiota bacterium]
MKAALQTILILAAVAFASGCRSTGPKALSSGALLPSNTANAGSAPEGKWHTVQITPSERAKKISFCNKINPLWWYQNVDAASPPDWFRPGETRRNFKWSLRNPFHNFTFYVIGIADKKHWRSGCYPRSTGNPNGHWNFAVARYRFLFFPFLSYHRSKFDFYLGWRTSGNFGAKLNFNAKRPPKTVRPETQSTDPSDSSALPAFAP